MILYIIKSILCSALFIAAYYFLLEKEIIHRFKRWYLLITLLFSFGIPLITIEINQPARATQVSKVNQYFAADIVYSPDSTQLTSIPSEDASINFRWSTIFFIAYGIITAVLLVRVFNNFLSILSDVNDKTVKPYRDALLVLHDKHVIPYSFLNYIFITNQDSNDKHILLHELTHIRQQHTLDILFVELIHCLMWFNPALHFYKKAIRLNHEFLADEVVLKNFPTPDYQRILFQKTQISSGRSLTSSFNYSATKKRFIMMTTTKNQTRSVVKIVMTTILLLGTILIFSEKVYAQNDSIPQVVDHHQVKTDPQVAEFDTLIRKFTSFRKDKNGTEHIDFHTTGITDGEKSRMLEIYKGMTKEQKSKYPTDIYVVFTPMPQPKKQSPSAQQMVDFADPKVYGVWLDGKRIPNADLANYKSTDIAHVFMSRLMKNAAHYGQYKFHIDLMTHAYFDKSYPVKSE